MKQDIKTKPLNFGRAAFFRNSILEMEGDRTHSKDRQAVFTEISNYFPSLKVGRDEAPTDAEMATDKALPETIITLTRSQWNALVQGCIKNLIGTKIEAEKAKILAFSRLFRGYDECWKSLPDGDDGDGSPDGEEAPKPDA